MPASTTAAKSPIAIITIDGVTTETPFMSYDAAHRSVMAAKKAGATTAVVDEG